MVYIILPVKENYMIPNLNEYGLLPKGIHKATLKEIEQKFGSSSAKRKELFIGFLNLVQLLCKHKRSIKSFLLNGSFVTDKESPRDYDCILVVKKDFNFDSPEAEKLKDAKKLFYAHNFTCMEENLDRFHRLINLFGYEKYTERPKGLVEVIL
jgi:hypothetical protein